MADEDVCAEAHPDADVADDGEVVDDFVDLGRTNVIILKIVSSRNAIFEKMKLIVR
jgi:hypothetical protein